MINQEIIAKEVRLVGEESGARVIKLEEALALAEEQELDLICINSNSDVPIVKIGDYQQYCYELKKKQKDNQKKSKQKAQETKEIQLSDAIAEHDIKVKAKKVDKFLKNGDKVKIRIRFKSRRLQLEELANSKIQSLLDNLAVDFKFDSPVKKVNGEIYTIISLKK